MIFAIVAVDLKNGIATDAGIPWDLPGDRRYFRRQISGKTVLMGYGVYAELDEPLPGCRNLVATTKIEPLRDGFEPVTEAEAYLQTAQNAKQEVWIIGGAGLYASTIDYVDTVYLTQIASDFSCSKFFPDISHTFKRISASPDYQENGIEYHFEIWKRLSKNSAKK